MSKNIKCLDGLYGNNITNTNRRFTTPIFCKECDKTFEPKNGELIFKRCRDSTMDFFCPSCNDKHNKHWMLKSAEIIPDADNSGRGTARCTMADGRIEDIMYGWNNGENSDIPQKFYDDLAQFRQAYWDDKQAVLIKSLAVIDNFDTQQIICIQNNDSVTTLDYKVGMTGLIFDERQLSKVKPELMALITARLGTEYRLYIGGAK